MPGVSIQLCCWHAKRAWLRNLLEKVPDGEKRKRMLTALDKLMRLNVTCPITWSPAQLKELCEKELEAFYKDFEEETAYIDYFKREWASKIGDKFNQVTFTCTQQVHLIKGAPFCTA